MQRLYRPLVLLALLTGGCRSSSEPPHNAQAEPAQASMPALPILPPAAGGAAKSEQPSAAANGSREARLDALQSEFRDAQQTYYTAFRTALGESPNPSAEQVEKIRSELKAPEPEPYIARAQQLVDEDPTDLTAFHALAWLLDNSGTPEAQAGILAQLEKHHMDRPEMGELCDHFAQNAQPMLEKLAASSPHIEVRGRATFALAESLKQDLETAGYIKTTDAKDLEGVKTWLGAEKFAALQTLDAEQTLQQIEGIYERVVRDFGDVKVDAGTKRETTLGKQAGTALHEMRDLVVGKPAPEIEGQDLDSVAFKLSEYRGKVVLLDFWGNW